MSLSHQYHVIISKGRRNEKTIKKFISSLKNESPKVAQTTHSPFKLDKIIFQRVEKPHNPITFDFTSWTMKNYNKMMKNYIEQKQAHIKAWKKHTSTGYYFEYERASAKDKLDYKRDELTLIHNQLMKFIIILREKKLEVVPE